MGKTILTCLVLIILLLGSLTALWVHNSPLVSAIEAKQTDKIKTGIKDTVESVTARIEAQDVKTRTEVRVIRETVRTKVNALPADAVARGLNDELALWRGMASSAPGLDGD